MPKFSIDGRAVEAAEGRTILQALDDAGLLMNGVAIPHYCWHPKLSIDGSCRLCQVEVEGIPKLQIACNTVVQDGMVVRTDTEQVKSAREGVMELLLVNHPLDCPICDQAGECKLQDYAFEYGASGSRSREPRRALKKNVDLGPTIVFDQERCILCRRCVRFCDEIPGTRELAVMSRGDQSVIETFPGTPLANEYSMNVADLCPVGALTTKDFRFKIRVWFLDDVAGVCTGCSKGCNVHLGVANNKVYRYVPRRNDAVNDTWICDTGRMSYAQISEVGRLRQSAVRSERGVLEAVDYHDAVRVAAERLARLRDEKGAGVIAGIASPHATNEDLFVLKRFLQALGTENSGLAVVAGEADAILVESEKAPNAAGARALGFPEASGVIDRIAGGGIDGLVMLGHDLIHEQFLGDVEALGRLDTVIVLDPHASALDQIAHVIFPTRLAAEKYGTLTNSAGRVQRVRPAVEPSWEAHSEGDVLTALGVALGLAGFDSHFDARQISSALAAQIPAFAACSWDEVGESGASLEENPA